MWVNITVEPCIQKELEQNIYITYRVESSQKGLNMTAKGTVIGQWLSNFPRKRVFETMPIGFQNL